jgi:choline dehydrogenase
MDTFDFVIVGGGSAGSLLAYRLSEGKRKTVCVLEAGPPDRNPYIRMPVGFIKTLRNPSITWQFPTQPSVWTAGRSIALTQGKTLGGSSSVNGAIYNRGLALDFDSWAQLGNKGWAYRDVLPYFMRSETRIGDGDNRYRGRSGELPITSYDWPSEVCEAFVEGAVEFGIPRNPDYNGASMEGVGYYQSAILNGRRVSAAYAFLHPARRNHSVSVRTHAVGTRILFRDRKAVGIEYLRDGAADPSVVHAREGVILSAGVLNTPKLLQLSGIGPGPLLREHGIEVKLDLPGVGENLRDHYNARLVARGKRGTDTFNGRVTGIKLGLEFLKYLLHRPNVLSLSPALVHIFSKTKHELDQPDFCLGFTPGSYKLGDLGKLDDYPGLTCGGWRMRPVSKGYVRIKSADPKQLPEVQPNYLDHEEDRAVLVSALKVARLLLQSRPLQRFVQEETFPGPQVSTDEEWLQFARIYGGSSFHLVGTAKMGPKHDALAAVDDRLRVHGTEGLTVADASVMPTLVSANTYAATLMIAEKASDILLGRPELLAARI